ncbi:MAG: DUF1957 domain-containing protein, partial [Elusimicrobia bacterium]|nr:DUF1957 domain-containing protein [Elusimicrobiota bacterium]
CALAQSSDWALLAGQRRHGDWAAAGLARCVEGFLELRSMLEDRAVDAAAVERWERAGAILPSADFRVFA